MPKTGSTSIQNNLKDFDDGTTAYIQAGPANHSVFTQVMFEDPGRFFETMPLYASDEAGLDVLRKRMGNQFAQSVSRDRARFILSSEFMYHLHPGQLAAAVAFFRQYVDRIEVIGYVRKPRSYIQSAFQQKVKTGRAALTLDDPRYRLKLEKFVTSDGIDATHFKAFDPASFPSRSTLADFLQVIGVTEAVEEGEDSRDNASLSANATALLFRLNKLKANPLRDRSAFQDRTSVVDALVHVTGPKLRFTEALLQRAYQVSDVDWVASEFGIDLSEPSGSGGIECEDDLDQLADRATDALESVINNPRIPKDARRVLTQLHEDLRRTVA